MGVKILPIARPRAIGWRGRGSAGPGQRPSLVLRPPGVPWPPSPGTASASPPAWAGSSCFRQWPGPGGSIESAQAGWWARAGPPPST
ncbi:MAG: hypothetical protein ACK559_09220, partial [bacterium]